MTREREMQDPVRGGWKAEYLSEHSHLQFDQSMDVVLALARFRFHSKQPQPHLLYLATHPDLDVALLKRSLFHRQD